MDVSLKEKVERYLKAYFKGDENNFGEVELENIILNGREFLEASESYIEDLRADVDNTLEEEREKLKKSEGEILSRLFDLKNEYKGIVKDLEKLTKGKEGPIINKLNKLIEYANETLI